MQRISILMHWHAKYNQISFRDHIAGFVTDAVQWAFENIQNIIIHGMQFGCYVFRPGSGPTGEKVYRVFVRHREEGDQDMCGTPTADDCYCCTNGTAWWRWCWRLHCYCLFLLGCCVRALCIATMRRAVVRHTKLSQKCECRFYERSQNSGKTMLAGDEYNTTELLVGLYFIQPFICMKLSNPPNCTGEIIHTEKNQLHHEASIAIAHFAFFNVWSEKQVQ